MKLIHLVDKMGFFKTELVTTVDLSKMDYEAIEIFGNSIAIEISKSCYQNICKSYVFSQNLEGVAQKLCPPRTFKF